VITAKEMEQVIEVLRTGGYPLPNPMNVANYGMAWSGALSDFDFTTCNIVAFEWIKNADHFPTLAEFENKVEAWCYRQQAQRGECSVCDGVGFITVDERSSQGCPECNPRPRITHKREYVLHTQMPTNFAQSLGVAKASLRSGD